MADNQSKGKQGEDLAVEYLQSMGYDIVQRRYSCRYGEIDIIATQQNTIVFVEVKSRKSSVYGRPSEAVTIAKQRKIKLTAQQYMQQHGLDDIAVRFDVIEVYLSFNRVGHIEQAF